MTQKPSPLNYLYNLNTNLKEKEQGFDFSILMHDLILVLPKSFDKAMVAVGQRRTAVNAKLSRKLTIPSKILYYLPFHIPPSPE